MYLPRMCIKYTNLEIKPVFLAKDMEDLGPFIWSYRIIAITAADLIHWSRDKMVAIFQTIFKHIFLDENVWILIRVSQKFVSRGPINNIQALVPIMAWNRPGDKSLSEPVMVILQPLKYASLGLNELIGDTCLVV